MRSYLLAPLSEWASGSQAEAHLEQIFGDSLHWPTAYKHLSAFRSGDFSNLPPISILPPEQMPGLWGGYSRDLRHIFLSSDCPEEKIAAVLIEEIGHFLDQELCAEETPGEEGARFASAVLGLPADNFFDTDFLHPILLNGGRILVEAAVKVVTVGTPKLPPGKPAIADTSTSADGNTITANKTSVRLIQTKTNQRLIGSTGNDTYQVTSQNAIIEDSGGTDTIASNVSYSMANLYTVENLILTGAATNGTGNFLNNIITGNDRSNYLDGREGNDTLIGGAGNDTIIGGTGNDSMVGGTENDLYYVDSASDVVVETATGGTDSVSSSINGYTLANNTEVLILSGTTTSGRGNSLSNSLIGNASTNSLNGGGGNDYFDGGSGADTLIGEDGTDTLQGGLGNDSLVGGSGNDFYFVDSINDVVIESSNAGTDSVSSSVSGYSLSANTEVLILAGTTASSGTGNALANTLIGNSASNTLDGGTGADSLVGGAGDDHYFLDSSLDIVTEAAFQGTDSVTVSFSGYTLTSNAEVLIFTGLAGAATGTGNSLANSLIGNASNNALDGASGNDFLSGGSGNDTLIGGDGDDALGGGSGNDSLTGGNGNDILDGGIGNDAMIGGAGDDYYFVDSTSDIITEATSSGMDSVSSSAENYTLAGNTEILILTGTVRNGSGNALDNTLIGNFAANTLVGGGGNDYFNGGNGNDSMSGGDGNDTLVGGAGNDSMTGGSGNDYYFVDSTADIISDTFGTDSVSASVNYTLGVASGIESLILTGTAISGTGNTSDNTLIGNSLANSLVGGGGNDSFDGGNGADTLLGDSGTDTLDGGSGNDSLSGGAESDTLLGALGNDTLDGGTGNDSMSGGDGNDSLFGGGGNDTFDGGLGNDSMTGEFGNDYYYVDSSSDVVVESSGSEIDSVSASTSTYTLGDNLEVLILTGSGASGAGNSLANTLVGNATANLLEGGSDDDSLFGGGGDDTLDGGTGNDTMSGGTGDDVYYATSTSDVIIDSGGSNIIYYTDATVSPINIEISGTSYVVDPTNSPTVIDGISFEFIALNLYQDGDLGDNELSGGSGNDTINGLDGNDIIDGVSGNDSLIGDVGYDTIFGGLGRDTLTGDDGDDYLEGESGNDSIVGGNDQDTLLGGDDTDTLLGDSGNDFLSGDAGNDSLVAGSEDDTLLGGDGTDTLIGEDGNDVYYLDASNRDILIETSTSDTDTIVTNDSFSLFVTGSGGSNYTSTTYNEIENLVYDETFAGVTGVGVTLIGNTKSNSIQGGSGNDSLDGGVSLLFNQGDTLNGGLGSDTYVIDNPYDWIIEDQTSDSDNDIDTVYTYANFDPLPNDFQNSFTRAWSFANGDLSSFIRLDNFIFMGGAIRGIGNALNNNFTGNYENNVVLGLAGDDTIAGNDGDDSLYGDFDNLNVTDPSDTGADGYDSVTGTYPYNPGDFDISGITEIANQKGLIGDYDDPDWNQYGRDYLTGGDGNDYLAGNGNDDTLIGGDGNDIMQGGSGADSMVGAFGDDIYYIDDDLDTIIEVSNQGTDLVFSQKDIRLLQDNLENAVIYGSEITFAVGNSLDNAIYVSQIPVDFSGVTLSGGLGNDKLYGYYQYAVAGYAYKSSDVAAASKRYAADYLVGGDGNDYIDGGGNDTLNGTGDTLEGGLGNDTIVVDSTYDAMVSLTYDKIWEFGYEGDPVNGGNDWVVTSVNIDLKDVQTDSNFNGAGTTQLDYVENGMFIENIMLSGSDTLEAEGNWLNNYILGNQSNNTLSGEYGNDTLVGDAGNDSIFGGAGNDSLVGTNSSRAGFGEIDTLTGDGGSDIWVLGDANNVYYSGQCDLDYAYMTDYAGSTIELRGKLSDYLIKTVATGGLNPQPFILDINTGTNLFNTGKNLGNGTYIFLDNADARGRTGGLGTEDDLIAFAVNWTGSSTLKFVN